MLGARGSPREYPINPSRSWRPSRTGLLCSAGHLDAIAPAALRRGKGLISTRQQRLQSGFLAMHGDADADAQRLTGTALQRDRAAQALGRGARGFGIEPGQQHREFLATDAPIRS